MGTLHDPQSIEDCYKTKNDEETQGESEQKNESFVSRVVEVGEYLEATRENINVIITEMITIYTDGSSKGNPGPGGWAAIIFDNEKVYEIGGHAEHTTNNKMELTAAIEALRFVSRLSTANYLLFTDSKYVMMGITEWIHGWIQKGWRTAQKKPVLNQDLWQELLNVSEGRDISWKYVEGHAGHQHNERADEIATSFADGLTPNLYDGPREKYK